MAVMPRVHLFFRCAGVAVDETTNRITIVDPISSVSLTQSTDFPCFSGVLFFYVDLKEGLGKFHRRIEGRDEKQKVVVRTKPTMIEFSNDNRFDGIAFGLEMPEFELAEQGVYEFGLYANYAEAPIATTSVRFLKRG